MRRYVIVSCIVGCLLANTRSNNPANREFQIIRHNINQVEICVSNYGKFGQDETGNNAGCWWPIGSYHNYIYVAGIWFGTVDSLTGDTLVTVGYNTYDDSSEFGPGLHRMPVNHPAAVIYMYPENWPAPESIFPMAPQVAISHQDSWCCFNDCDSIYHVLGDTRPIGIEVYQTVYAWNIDLLEDLIFFTFEVKNISNHTLHNCYIGIAPRCGIGYTDPNDRCSAIVERLYSINGDTISVDNVGYQWQEGEEPGTPPWFPGTVGFDLLQTPFDLVEGMDKDGDGILDQYERDSAYYVNNLPPSMWDADNDGVPDWRDPSQWPQLGMTAFKRFCFPHPDSDIEYFLTMAGYNFITGQYEPFDTIPPDPDDWWILIESSGPFSLVPDSSVTLIFAVMFADWRDDYLRPDTALALIDQWAQDYYDMYWHLYTGIEENYEFRISDCEMNILPNPISGNGTVSFSLPKTGHVSLKLYNLAGQLINTLVDQILEPGHYTAKWDRKDRYGHHVASGVYFLKLQAGNYSATEKLLLIR